jgi:hypothetical protein
MGESGIHCKRHFNGDWIMKLRKSQLKSLIKEIVREVSKDDVDENWKGLAAAGLMGYAALHNPTGQQYMGRAKQAWTQAVQRKQAMNQQATQQRQFQNPTQELPSEKGMNSWDLADKYTNRNVSLAQKLKPATNAWLKEDNAFNIDPIQGQNEKPEDAFLVEYVRPMPKEKPFFMPWQGVKAKFEYCIGRYPNGKEDIAVYAYRGDMCYGYNAFNKLMGIH